MAAYFLNQFPHLEEQDVVERFKKGEVVTADCEVLSADSPYQAGQHIYFYRELKTEIIVPFEESVIYEDENIVVADKPHFLPVAPTGQYLHETLVVRLRNKLGIDELEPCHRIDRETAGLVLLSKKTGVRHAYHSLFAEREITKTYHALAATSDLDFPLVRKSRIVKAEPFFRMQEQDGKANSETHIDLKESRGECSLYEIHPVTGRQHQIRVHMAALNLPIINDSIYPDYIRKQPDEFTSPLQLLAKSLQFIDPVSGSKRYFQSTKFL